jgi:hypothetical protein
MKRPAAIVAVACLLWLGLPLGLGVGVSVPEARAEGDDPSGSVPDDLSVGIGASVTSIVGVKAVINAHGGAIRGAALFDQGVIDNWVEEQAVTRHVLIQDAFQNNQGIVSVNQEAGNLNNQANIRVLALGLAGSALQGVDLAGSARRIDNTVISSGGERENRIVGSFGGTVGVVGANQSAGNLNQQANVLVLAVGVTPEPGLVALGDATLGEVSAHNTLVRKGETGPRADIITDSFGGFRGIAQVNQSSGDLNITGNFFGLSLSVLTLP